MRHYINLFILLLLTGTLFMGCSPNFIDNYEKAWKEVDEIMDEKPRTAISMVKDIYATALRDKDEENELRAYCYFNEIDGDLEYIEKLSEFCERTQDTALRSIAQFILANELSSRTRYNSSSTTMNGEYPKDIEEWSYEMFLDSIDHLQRKALEPMEVLSKTDAMKYSYLTKSGTDSRKYRPTLFDLLAYSIIEKNKYRSDELGNYIKADFIIEQLIKIHANDTETDAYIYALMQKKQPLSELYRLYDQYKNQEASNLILDQICSKDYNEYADDDKTSQKLNKMIEESFEKFPDYAHPELVKWYNEIHESKINYTTRRVARPDEKIRIHIKHKNQTGPITFSIFDSSNKLVDKVEVKLKPVLLGIQLETIAELPALKKFGSYKICPSKTDTKDSLKITISNLHSVVRKGIKNKDDYKTCRIYVFHSGNGKALKDVKVKLKKNNKTTSILHINEQGFAEFTLPKGESVHSYQLIDKEDHLFVDKYIFSYDEPKYYKYEGKGGIAATIITDRDIYRPGQKIHYKCILSETSRVLANKKAKIQLVSLEAKTYESQEKTTNEFGSFSGSFTLPDKIDGTEVAIVWEDFILKHLNVEEYKRPSFEIKTNDINHCYTFGDKVELSGTISYLTGIPVANAKVAYQITQEYYRNYESEAISSDTIHTDSYGKFKLSFTPHCDDPKENTAIYYCVKLTATDLNGETQSSNYSFLIGTKPIFLSMDFNISEEKQLLLMEELNKAVVQAKNTSGNNIDTDITVEVAQSGKVIAKEIVKPNKTNSFTHFDTKKWESGSYKVTLTAKDEKGRIAKREYDIVLYRKTDPRPATHQELMVIKDFSDEINWGDTLHFRIGSSLMGQHAKYIIEDTNGIKEEQELLLNNEFKDVFYPFSSQNGKRLKISILLINNHIEYEEAYDCRRGKENKQLDLELTSFRDKTTPGSHEKWTISVKEKEHPAEIAVLAYDKSLDLLLRDDEPEFYRGFYWNFSTEEEETIHSEWSFQDRCINSYCYFHEENKKKTSGYREWNFDSFLKIPFHGSKIHGSEMECLALSCEEECIDIEEEIAPSSTSTPPPPPPGIKNENILMEEETSSMSTNVNLRKNFAETAFFYPHLKTNESGKATFEFTVPDQLTTWKFQAFAHTKDLHAGQLEKVFICRKEFFITPNLPRFVRQGDLCCFSAKVSNLSSKEMSGKAILEIKNLASKKLIEKKEVPFHLSANKTDAVKWTVKIPDDLDMIEVKTIVQSGSQTDGEVSQLPVLSDRTLVTQSLPLTIRGNQTKSFTFNQLKQNQSDTRQDKALTLEFCSNPIWYAVAALPSIATPEEECSICLSHAYYCSVLAQGIANSHPSIAKTIQAWKNEGDESALHSELEKNPQLKNILLAESPWVADAQREKRQRQELSFLFDTPKQQENRQRLLERLNHLRNPNGAYTWFNGMIESRHITLQVLEEMGRLRQLYPDLFSKEEMTKYQQSLQYLDKKLKEDFEDLRRANPRDYNKTTYISMDKLRLFYVHTLYPEFPIEKGCQEAYEFFQKRIDIDWLKRSLYGQALTAIILQRNGEKKTARRIINSLREHSSSDETMGMYWEGNVAGYFWHESTIATQALLIEAFQEIDPQTKELDNLRIWLLNQKRTQRWENETETIQALYALLLTGTDWLGDENKAHISMGGKEIKPQKEMVGTGYFTHDFEAKEITPALADISVKKEGKSLAWGAVYWQFTEKMEKVESSKNEIEIKKTMTIERNVNNRKVLEPITDKTKLKVGDKLVIRLVIKSQREMEYVTLKDQKPACLEPTEQISGYHWDNRLSYYQIQKDASMNFFFEYIPKGTFVVEYPLWVTHAGEFTNGIATLQCLYAPAFVANSKGTEKMNIAKE